MTWICRLGTWLDIFIRDLQFAARMLRRAPLSAAIVISTLALGIAATTAVFSILQAVLLQPLPYRDPDQLVAVWDAHVMDRNLAKVFASYDDFQQWKQNSQGFEQLAAATWATGDRILTGRGPARAVLAIPASLDFFAVLGVAPLHGRLFQLGDLTAGCTVVLAHRFWQTALAARSDAIGESLAIDERACTVVGIMPPDFTFYPDAADMWMLIDASQPMTAGVGVFGRLKPGVDARAAQDELVAVHATAHGNDEHSTTFKPAVYRLHGEFTWLASRTLRMTLLMLFAAVIFVLLIVCANVANVLLGRSIMRQREFAVRSALGADRARLIGQLLTESMLLTTIGALFGLLLALWAVDAFRAVNPVTLPPGRVVTVNLQVLGFATVLTILTALAAGVAPAWGAARADATTVLNAGGRVSTGRRPRQLGKMLVVIETTLAVVLLIGAGLLIESVVRLGRTPLGFEVDGLLTSSVRLPQTDFPTPQHRLAFYEELVTALNAVPGVNTIALTTSVLRGRGTGVLSVEGQTPLPAAAIADVGQDSVSFQYFRTVGLPLIEGRLFDASDRLETEPVAIVNEALARKYFPDQSPIGRRAKIGSAATSTVFTIVGVVGNQKATNVYEEMTWVESPFVYRPFAQTIPSQAIVVMRSAVGPASLGATIRRVVADLHPNVPLGTVGTVRRRVAENLAYPRFRAVVLAGFAALALLLAVVGLYGVLSQLVAQRTHEIGVRMALGASKRAVLVLIASEGMLLASVGLVFGVLVASWLTRFIRSMLYTTRPMDGAIVGGVLAVLLAVAFLAVFLPARRAASIDPIAALRQE
jgi:putative ABC transport system permease protein